MESLISGRPRVTPASPLEAEWRPWWHAADQLLTAVLRHGAADREFAFRLVEAVGAFAQGDPKYAQALRSSLKRPRRGRRATPPWEHMRLALDYAVLESAGPTLDEICLMLAPLYGVEKESMPRKIARARRMADPKILHQMLNRVID